MKIRSTIALNEFFDNELSWRKRELTTIKLLLDSRRLHEQQALLRASMCILYAHWEGFVKKATTGYLNYVALKGLRYCDLAPNFVALGLRARLRAAEESNRMTVHTEVTSFLLSDMQEKTNLPWCDVINTAGNLNSDVLREIFHLLALNYTAYETKKVLIDEKLLGCRNRIAHGEQFDLEVSDYKTTHAEIISLIEMFRNDLENAAQTESFRRSGS